MSKAKKGLTLLEVLLVASLLAIIGGTLYKTFVNGLKIWEAVYRYNIEENLAFFFDMLNTDLNNIVYYQGFEFEGGLNEIIIPAVVRVPADPLGSGSLELYADQIGKVRYQFIISEHRLVVKRADYSQSLKNEFLISRVLVEGIDDVQFHYFFKEEDSESSGDVKIPSSVEVEVKYHKGFSTQKIYKTFNVPLGC